MESGEPGAGRGNPLETGAKDLLLKIPLKKKNSRSHFKTEGLAAAHVPRGCTLPAAARRGRSRRPGSARPAPGGGCFTRRLPGQASPSPPRQAACRPCGGARRAAPGSHGARPSPQLGEGEELPRPFLN